MKIIMTLSLSTILVGCSGANISSQIRESPKDYNSASMMLRCLDFSTGNDSTTNYKLMKYDGWKMVYVSEYTTFNKVATNTIVCFEKPYSDAIRTDKIIDKSNNKNTESKTMDEIGGFGFNKGDLIYNKETNELKSK